MKKILFILISCISITLIYSQEKTEFKYLFVGHTYLNETNIDIRLESLNKEEYDNIWLGGDILSETLLHDENLEYLQTHLHICDPHNYFSFGNHDLRNGNFESFKDFTGKDSYYADHYNGITYITLDTNLDPSDCENLDKQFKLICNVTDTISESSHLILLFHWGLWSGVPGLPDAKTYAHTDLKYWSSNCDSANTNFASTIYPLLVKVKERNIDVICIMGDMGASYKKIDMRSTDDIIFLGCGLYNIQYIWQPGQWWAYEKDLILEFNHNITSGTLSWSYRDIDSLLDVQNGYKYITKLTFDDSVNYQTDDLEYINYGNYMYRFNANGDSLVIVNDSSQYIYASNNEILFSCVLKSTWEYTSDQILISYRLKNDNEIIEEHTRTISSIPNDNTFYQQSTTFSNPIQTTDILEITIKSTTSIPILLNNAIVKYKLNTKLNEKAER